MIHNHEVRGSFPRLATEKINHLHINPCKWFLFVPGWCLVLEEKYDNTVLSTAFLLLLLTGTAKWVKYYTLMKIIPLYLIVSIIIQLNAAAQPAISILQDNCKAIRATDVLAEESEITSTDFKPDGWIDAVVPGTILTTLLHNNQIPDPFSGLNTNLIPYMYYLKFHAYLDSYVIYLKIHIVWPVVTLGAGI
jgi:hypothetical protein